MTTKNLVFRKVAETKGAVRYAEVLAGGVLANQPNDPGAHIGTQYWRKTAFNGGAIPNEIRITAEW